MLALLVFSGKNREPVMADSVRPGLYSYTATILGVGGLLDRASS